MNELGDVFVATANFGRRGGVVALRDTNRDGTADVVSHFGANGGHGIAILDSSVYFATNDAVLRYTIPAGALEPVAGPDTIVAGLRSRKGRTSHITKSIVLKNGADLYVSIGSPSNSCQMKDRLAGSPGILSCPELDRGAGIWLFDAQARHQRQDDGKRYATGLRNVVALATDPSGALYGVVHGRDALYEDWMQLFSRAYGHGNPAELFVRIEEGDDYGWPYCYFPGHREAGEGGYVLAPEYHGDGKHVGRCASVKPPIYAFPAHWAPDGLVFYTSRQFPNHYWDGAFVAFHGSQDRDSSRQGFSVVFLPFKQGRVNGMHELFASGFEGANGLNVRAEHRPVGLALASDGALLVTDDVGGRVYRISYQPAKFRSSQ